MNDALTPLDGALLERFDALRPAAITSVCDRFYGTHGSIYQRFGPKGRERCREDLAFLLEFLRPVLEFGLVETMVEYLSWLRSVLAARAIPGDHVLLSLEWVGQFLALSMEPADARKVGLAVRDVAARLAQAPETPAVAPLPDAPWPEAKAFETALLSGSQRGAAAIVDRSLADGRGLVDVEMGIIQPSLYHVGEQWQANLVSVAQEHMATAIARAVMTNALLNSAPPASKHKRVLLACVEGNHHGLGLHMVADAFQLNGWDVQYLGADVPNNALVKQALAWEADLVGLSVSFAQQAHAVREAIALLAAERGAARPPVFVGGLAINRFDVLAKLLGADAHFADARSAAAGAERITTRKDGALLRA